MLEGIARKISFFIILVSAIGWICFDVGLGMEEQSQGKNIVLQWSHFCSWCFAASGLLLYLFYMIHLLAHYSYPIPAVLTLALLLPFLVSAGGVLNKIGNDGLNRSTQVYFLAQFAGAGWAVTTLWISLLFWPFHEGKKRGQYEPLITDAL
ncbi:hypothetical protein EMCRGX_G025035 [Ephydatia muelleri]